MNNLKEFNKENKVEEKNINTESNKKEKDMDKEKKDVRFDLAYDDKVIKKIVGKSLESVDGLLSVSGGFFTNLKNKTLNSDDVTDGINVEVGKKEIAVDLDIIVEYNKVFPEIAEEIKNIVKKDVNKMTNLKLVEININIVDVKTKEEHEEDSVTIQDRLENAAQSTGDYVSEKYENAKEGIEKGVDSAKESTENISKKIKDAKDSAEEKIEEKTEPRVN